MVTIRLAVSVTRCVIIRGMCSAPQPLLAATICFRPTPDDAEARLCDAPTEWASN